MAPDDSLRSQPPAAEAAAGPCAATTSSDADTGGNAGHDDGETVRPATSAVPAARPGVVRTLSLSQWMPMTDDALTFPTTLAAAATTKDSCGDDWPSPRVPMAMRAPPAGTEVEAVTSSRLSLSSLFCRKPPAAAVASDNGNSPNAGRELLVCEEETDALGAAAAPEGKPPGWRREWEDDPQYVGMEYMGCEHQYSEVHYVAFRRAAAAEQPPMLPPPALHGHWPWRAAFSGM
eukprot:SM000232S07954  [mRNA]  locus=s232:117376:118379:+ [translate_table: standard]